MTPSASPARAVPSLGPAQLRDLRHEVEELNAEYAHVLDEQDLERWIDFFTDDAIYRVTARENFDNNLPLGLVYCEGRGMLRDRVTAITKTTTYAPRYIRHFLGPVRITGMEEDGTIQTRANYMVMQTELERPTEPLQIGQYVDRITRKGGLLRYKERHCVYDSLLIRNSLVFPV
jgi:anthranilate 1,2-dioxygenase small subunit